MEAFIEKKFVTICYENFFYPLCLLCRPCFACYTLIYCSLLNRWRIELWMQYKRTNATFTVYHSMFQPNSQGMKKTELTTKKTFNVIALVQTMCYGWIGRVQIVRLLPLTCCLFQWYHIASTAKLFSRTQSW